MPGRYTTHSLTPRRARTVYSAAADRTELVMLRSAHMITFALHMSPTSCIECMVTDAGMRTASAASVSNSILPDQASVTPRVHLVHSPENISAAHAASSYQILRVAHGSSNDTRGVARFANPFNIARAHMILAAPIEHARLKYRSPLFVGVNGEEHRLCASHLQRCSQREAGGMAPSCSRRCGFTISMLCAVRE